MSRNRLGRVELATALWLLTACGSSSEKGAVSLSPEPQEPQERVFPSSPPPPSPQPTPTPTPTPDGGTVTPPPPLPLPSPVVSGQLIAAEGGTEMFLVHQGRRHRIPSDAVLQSHGYTAAQLRRISPQLLAAIPAGVDMGYREGTLVKTAAKPDVYIVDQVGELPNAVWNRRFVINQSVFEDCRFPGLVIQVDAAIETSAYRAGPNVGFCSDENLVDGELISSTDSTLNYVLSLGDGTKRPEKQLLSSEQIRASHGYAGLRVAEVSPADFAVYATGPARGFAEGTLIRLGGDSTAPFYVVERRGNRYVRRLVLDTCNLDYYGLSGQSLVVVTQAQLDLHPLAEPVPDGCPND